jgi:hypothetical protein
MMKKIKIYDDCGRNEDYTCTAIYEDDFIILALIDEVQAAGYLTEAERRIVINKENRQVLFYNNQFYYMEKEST